MKIKILLISAIAICIQMMEPLQAQVEILSLHISPAGKPEAAPVLQLNSQDILLLEFDIPGSSAATFSYKLIQCDAQWQPSGLFFSDFQTGFELNPVPAPISSINTLFDYQHYSLQIPNEDVEILLSGNYLLELCDPYNSEQIYKQIRFYVCEQTTTITGSYTPSRNADWMKYRQEIQFNCQLQTPVENPYREIQVVVQQNRNPITEKQGIQPDYIKGNELIFSNDANLTWDAGNEFRFFNVNDIRFASEGIQTINFEENQYHYKLLPQEKRRFKRFLSYSDINGQFRIDKTQSKEPEREADYVWIELEMPMEAPFLQEDLYLIGEFSNYLPDSSFICSYSYDKKAYTARFMLKQGYYNYLFALINKDLDKKLEIDTERLEGNFSATENEYMIFVYYQPAGERYQRLIGCKSISRYQ